MNEGSRSDWSVPALVVMAVAGAGIASYLTLTHVSSVPLVCTVGSAVNCAAVTHSAYSMVPGTSIPISLVGVAWFVAVGVLALIGPRWLHFGWAALGLVVALYLIYVEIVILHQICEWCTAVHLLVIATFVQALYRFQQDGLKLTS